MFKNKYVQRYVLRNAEGEGSGGGGGNTPPRVVPPVLPTDPNDRSVSRYELELRDEAAKSRAAKQAAETAAETARAEAATLKQRLADLEATQAATSSKIEETVKATTERLEKEYAAKAFKNQIKAAVADKLLDPDEIDNLDLSKVTVNDKGQLEGVDALLDNLRAKRPYVFTDYHVPQTSTAARANRTIPGQNKTPEYDAMKDKKADYEAKKRKFLSGQS